MISELMLTISKINVDDIIFHFILRPIFQPMAMGPSLTLIQSQEWIIEPR